MAVRNTTIHREHGLMPAQLWRRIKLSVTLVALLPSLAVSQSNPQSSGAASSPENTPEITSHDETTTFKVKVNLVEVRVVVRDPKGHAIGNLKQENFQLLDNGKAQVINRFSEEQAGGSLIIHRDDITGPTDEKTAQPVQQPAVPSRYIVYLFDDIHLQFADLSQARNAASRQFQSLQPSDRAAIYTTSGQIRLDLTGDAAQLTATLNRIVPHPIANIGTTPCPNISYYMADLIENRNDPDALRVATQDAIDCGAVSPAQNALTGGEVSSPGVGQIQPYVHRALDLGDQETRISMGVLQDVIRHLTAMPGQRIVILVSPGFINPDALSLQSELTERALHSGVVISSLDARGVYTDLPDAGEQRVPSASIAGKVQQYRTQEQQANEDILADLADATGGTFFHHNNDLDEGFRRLAGPPEVSYLLAFSPQGLKLDGHYHKLKVILKPPAQGTVQARKGYYAPKGSTDASEQARQAIEDAVFSQEEVREIPIELHTQFFKSDATDAKLSVVARLDVRHVHFRKADGRNNNAVTVVSALFDRNGNFVTGNQKVVQMHLKDDTLGRLNSGITLKSNFDVKPGSYIVRLVVRDEDGQLAAQNKAVEIP